MKFTNDKQKLERLDISNTLGLYRVGQSNTLSKENNSFCISLYKII